MRRLWDSDIDKSSIHRLYPHSFKRLKELSNTGIKRLSLVRELPKDIGGIVMSLGNKFNRIFFYPF